MSIPVAHLIVVSLLGMMTVTEAPTHTPGIMCCFRVILFLSWLTTCSTSSMCSSSPSDMMNTRLVFSCSRNMFRSILMFVSPCTFCNTTRRWSCPKKILFLTWLCRIRFVRFPLKISAMFFSFFDILPHSVGWSDFRTFSCQLYRTVGT